MKAFTQKFFAGLIFATASLSASAIPLSDYNLILLGDLNSNSIHVYEKTFIGGNINATGWVEFGSRMDKSSRENSLEVVGNLNGPGMHVQAGYAAYSGNNNLGNVNCNGNGLGGGACRTAGADLSGKAADLTQQLYSGSQEFASLLGNGDLFTKGNDKKLQYDGSDKVAVFNLDGTSLFNQNSNWSLFAGAAETVIINVSGFNIVNAGGVNLNNGFGAHAGGTNLGASNILWNFYEATSIDFGSMRMNGSVLAPYANVTMKNDFDGALAAKSYSGSGQVHNFLFDWTPPPVKTEVPESSTLMLLLMGLGLISLARLRR
jgi:choice-of-anchor A domain-containing protein